MRVALKQESLRPIPIAFISYLALAVGGIGLGSSPSFDRAIISSLIFMTAAYVLLKSNSLERFFLSLLSTTTLFLIVQSARAENYDLALQKIDGFIVAGFFFFVITYYGYSKYKLDFMKATVFSGAIILILTIFYKFYFGFWSRDVRFFLNGPIVFGWMMSYMSLTALYLYSRGCGLSYVVLGFLFLIAITWTGSKGPLVAYFFSVILFLFLERRLGLLVFFCTTIIVIALLALEFNLLPERLLVINRIISNDLIDSDFGSIGSRQAMWDQSVLIFSTNPMLGVGMGNWSSKVPDAYLQSYGFIYPHNIIAETLSEYGLTGAILLTLLIMMIYKMSGNFSRGALAFSIVALLFTGDMTYWRFLIFLPLAFAKEVKI